MVNEVSMLVSAVEGSLQDLGLLEGRKSEQIVRALMAEFGGISEGHHLFTGDGSPITTPADYALAVVEGFGTYKAVSERAWRDAARRGVTSRVYAAEDKESAYFANLL